jgi:hypothetical protein
MPGGGPPPIPPVRKKGMPVWLRIVVGFVGIFAIIGGFKQIFGGGHDVKYGKDDIRYYHDATHSDADALAKALTDIQFFGSNPDGLTVLLDKQGDSVTLSYVVKPDKINDPDTLKIFHDLSVDVAKSVPGTLTKIRLVDDQLNEKQSTGV